MKLPSIPTLPLLAKELIEQSVAKRTYVLRVIYAVLIYSFALLQYSDIVGSGGFENMGRGAQLFRTLNSIQFGAIFILLPVITCGALTVEKEKDTLALLLLTKLSPATIVIEKLLSRIFAMGTYQLLSLPLYGIIYGIGGVEWSDLMNWIKLLTAANIVVASISIMCSTWFRTTSEAFFMTYVVLLGCFSCYSLGPYTFITIVAHYTQNPGWAMQQGLTWDESSFATVTMIGSLLFSLVCLLIATQTLVRRAFVQPRNIVLQLFHRADRFFNDLNNMTTGGIVLVKDRDELPLFRPLSWRETRKRSLGTFRYQFRILMFLSTPLILTIATVMSEKNTDFTSPFRGFPVFFWIVSAFCVTIHSTGIIHSERIRQSLDVLLVAPLSSSEIVLEKLAGVRRLIKVLLVPFVILTSFQAIWTGYVVRQSIPLQQMPFITELVASILAPLIFLPLIMWIGFQYGTRLRTQMRAIIATFFTLLAMCVLPVQIVNLLAEMNGLHIQAATPDQVALIAPLYQFIYWLNPLVSIFSNLWTQPNGYSHPPKSTNLPSSQSAVGEPELLLVWSFGFYLILLWILRRNAIRSFASIVHRTEPDDKRLAGREDLVRSTEPQAALSSNS